MTELHSLTIRTNAAVGRLADLERRAALAGSTTTPVIRPALKELGVALEELKAANEHLQAQVSELAAVREQNSELARRLEEFTQVVPIVCVWTDRDGLIVEANNAAAQLFNVARPRLAGKPMMLFLGDRQAFFSALRALEVPGAADVELTMDVRPRERRSRAVRLTGRVMKEDHRLCWFITQEPQHPSTEPATPR